MARRVGTTILELKEKAMVTGKGTIFMDIFC